MPWSYSPPGKHSRADVGGGFWWLIAGLAAGLGILSKGPVALILALPPLALSQWLRGKPFRLISWNSLRFRVGDTRRWPCPGMSRFVFGCRTSPVTFSGNITCCDSCRRSIIWSRSGITPRSWRSASCLARCCCRLCSILDAPARPRIAETAAGLVLAFCCWQEAGASSSSRCPAASCPLTSCPLFHSWLWRSAAFGPAERCAIGAGYRRRRWSAFGVLCLGSHAVLPWYARYRGTVTQMPEVLAYCEDRNLRILCYPRPCDSLAFYSGRDDLHSFRSKETNQLILSSARTSANRSAADAPPLAGKRQIRSAARVGGGGKQTVEPGRRAVRTQELVEAHHHPHGRDRSRACPTSRSSNAARSRPANRVESSRASGLYYSLDQPAFHPPLATERQPSMQRYLLVFACLGICAAPAARASSPPKNRWRLSRCRPAWKSSSGRPSRCSSIRPAWTSTTRAASGSASRSTIAAQAAQKRPLQPRGRRSHPHPRRHQGRGQGGQGDRLLPGARDPRAAGHRRRQGSGRARATRSSSASRRTSSSSRTRTATARPTARRRSCSPASAASTTITASTAS